MVIIKENFLIFTSKPINGIKCTKITDTNIKGENKSQYIADNVHTYDANLHKLTQSNECHSYYTENKEKISYFETKLKSLAESSEE